MPSSSLSTKTGASHALLELPAGLAVFRLPTTGDNDKPELENFRRYRSTVEALRVSTSLADGDVSGTMSRFLRRTFKRLESNASLAVRGEQLGRLIQTELSIPCVHGSETLQVFRSLRSHVESLLSELVTTEQLNQTSLGLAHQLNRYKLKFSPEKIDLMVIQAVALLEDLDKEINKYAMRAREWFGWHFPEMSKLIQDNALYCKVVLALGNRFNAPRVKLDHLIEDESQAESIRDAALKSMGTEISKEDEAGVGKLCQEVVAATQYRGELAQYLTHRMNAIAPNLTTMVGEIIGARLIAKAGSLLSLAKYPASTVQMLGAEKALFRALKKREPTPKYGILYHASVVAKAPSEKRGSMSRALAAKTSLSARIDSFGGGESNEAALEFRTKMEQRLQYLEEHLGDARGSRRGAAYQIGQGAQKRGRSQSGPRMTPGKRPRS